MRVVQPPIVALDREWRGGSWVGWEQYAAMFPSTTTSDATLRERARHITIFRDRAFFMFDEHPHEDAVVGVRVFAIVNAAEIIATEGGRGAPRWMSALESTDETIVGLSSTTLRALRRGAALPVLANLAIPVTPEVGAQFDAGNAIGDALIYFRLNDPIARVARHRARFVQIDPLAVVFRGFSGCPTIQSVSSTDSGVAAAIRADIDALN